MFRDRRLGVRRVLQVAEFEEMQDSVRANILYRWIPEGDKIIRHAESSRFFEELARNTGSTQSEIEENLSEKSKILEYLINNSIRTLKDFGKIMNYYYTNKDFLIESIRKNNITKILGG